MRLFKDRDPYVYNDSLYKKKKKQEDRFIRIISALLACEIYIFGLVFSLETKYIFDRNNPFDGNSISSSDFNANYKAMKARSITEDETLKETIEYIKNSGIDEKKAYLLYYALIANQDLTPKEKKNLSGYIQYFIDNKDLDYEYVYNKFVNLIVNSNDPSILERGALASYFSNNSITYANEEAREISNSHEIFHAEDKLLENNSENIRWLTEGLTDLLSYEYHNKVISYLMETNFCRILCEFIDPNILLETRAKADINILINALLDKGLEQEEVTKLLELFNKYKLESSEENPDYNSIKIEILELLQDIALKIYKNSDYVSPMFYQQLLYFENEDGYITNKKYYFNSTKTSEKPTIIKNSTVSYYAPEGTICTPGDPSMMRVEKKELTEYHEDCILERIIIDEQGMISENITTTYIKKDVLNERINEIIDNLLENSKIK